ncbi:protein TIME FOR COFFEE [Abeliophyllum distichum]|uniref:Protein TIME FOR COFFEE n=1 Tax=Abeliophyllum distichum TaxID=126358 RepID=A0ABD1QZF3_9LAMI
MEILEFSFMWGPGWRRNRSSIDGKSQVSSPMSNSSSSNNPILPLTSSPLSVVEKIPGSEAEIGYDMGHLVNSQGVAAQPPEPILPEAMKVGSESKPVDEELRKSRDSATNEEVKSRNSMLVLVKFRNSMLVRCGISEGTKV